MINNYLNYRDIIFINKRVTKTKLGRTLLLFCGINSEGYNILLALAFLVKEDESCYEYAIN
jgi:hypothetical protein